MLPQLDFSFYSSQFFWLVVCFCILIFAFKKFFIPRMNNPLSRRDTVIENGKISISRLEAEIEKLENEINNMKSLEIKKSAEIIKNVVKKSEKILRGQLMVVKDENEQLITGMRKRFKDEMKSLESTFKIQIDITSEILFDKLFEDRRNI